MTLPDDPAANAKAVDPWANGAEPVFDKSVFTEPDTVTIPVVSNDSATPRTKDDEI